MKPYDILRHTFSTVIYTIVLAAILYFNNIGVNWVFHHTLLPAMDWFYGIAFIWKFFLIVSGLIFVVGIAMSLYSYIAIAISLIVSNLFLENLATLIISIVLCFGNIIFITIGMVHFWVWDFWLILFWLTIWFFVFQMNTVFVFRGKQKNYE